MVNFPAIFRRFPPADAPLRARRMVLARRAGQPFARRSRVDFTCRRARAPGDSYSDRPTPRRRRRCRRQHDRKTHSIPDQSRDSGPCPCRRKYAAEKCRQPGECQPRARFEPHTMPPQFSLERPRGKKPSSDRCQFTVIARQEFPARCLKVNSRRASLCDDIAKN